MGTLSSDGLLLDKICFPFASRTSLVWHDPKRQELQEKEAHMSAAVEQFVQAVSKVLEDNHIQGEKREVKVLGASQRAQCPLRASSCWFLLALFGGSSVLVLPAPHLTARAQFCLHSEQHCELLPGLGVQAGTCWAWLGFGGPC